MIGRFLAAVSLAIVWVPAAFSDEDLAADSGSVIDVEAIEVGGKIDALTWAAEDVLLVLSSSRNPRGARLVELQRNGTAREVFATTKPFLAIAKSPSSGDVACAMWRETNEPYSSEVEIWRYREREKISTLSGIATSDNPRMKSDVLTVCYSPDGSLIAGGSKLVADGDIGGSHLGGEVWVWDLKQRKLLWSNRSTHTDIVYAAVFSPDGQILASAGQDKLLRLWEPRSGKLLKTLHGAAWDGIVSLSFLDRGGLLASGGQGREEGDLVRVWDVDSGRLLHTLRGFKEDRTVRVAAAAISKRLYGVGLRESSSDEQPEWHIQCWDARSGKLLDSFSPRPGSPRTIAVSKDENIAVGTAEGQVVVFKKPNAGGLKQPPMKAD